MYTYARRYTHTHTHNHPIALVVVDRDDGKSHCSDTATHDCIPSHLHPVNDTTTLIDRHPF